MWCGQRFTLTLTPSPTKGFESFFSVCHFQCGFGQGLSGPTLPTVYHLFKALPYSCVEDSRVHSNHKAAHLLPVVGEAVTSRTTNNSNVKN